MKLRIEDLKVGDVVKMIHSGHSSGNNLVGMIMEITEIIKYESGISAYTNISWGPYHSHMDKTFFLDEYDEFEYAISHLNEQKLKKVLGLNE